MNIAGRTFAERVDGQLVEVQRRKQVVVAILLLVLLSRATNDALAAHILDLELQIVNNPFVIVNRQLLLLDLSLVDDLSVTHFF